MLFNWGLTYYLKGAYLNKNAIPRIHSIYSHSGHLGPAGHKWTQHVEIQRCKKLTLETFLCNKEVVISKSALPCVRPNLH